jgi:WD40 repeat protein
MGFAQIHFGLDGCGMRRSMYTIMLVVLVLASILPLASAQGLDESQPWPFIYYYSYKTGSWIVERADGSDGFAFGAGLNCGMIWEGNWSPSGRWLLWNCENREYRYANRWIAVRGDDSQRVTALDWFNDLLDDYAFARWSPTDDLILVYTLYRPPAPDQRPEWGPGVYIIDAAQDKMIVQMTFDVLIDHAEWSPDGRYVLAYSSEREDDRGTDKITVIPVNGDPSFTPDGIISPGHADLIWTPDSRLISHDQESGQLILDDLNSSAREALPFTTQPFYGVQYSPDQQYGLIYVGTELWLYTVAAGELIRVADDAIFPFDAHDWPYDQPSFVMPNWSPDNRRVLFARQDGRLYWLYPDGQVTAVNLPPVEEEFDPFPRVQWGGDQAFILWNNVVYIYDLPTEAALATFTETDSYSQLHDAQASPDGRYLAHPASRYVGYFIWDWAQDEDRHITATPVIGEAERMAYSTGRWYPGQDILFVSEGFDLAGPGLSYWSVASADGRLLRALSSTSHHGGPQALPDRVDTSFIPHAAQALVPNPSLQITEDHWGYGMMVWSPDGRYLASAPSLKRGRYYDACTGGDPVRLYDTVTGAMAAEFSFESCGCGYEPPTDEPDNRWRGLYLSVDTRRAQTPSYLGYPVDLVWTLDQSQSVLAMPIYTCNSKVPYRLILWDSAANTLVADVEHVRAVAFSRDGAQVALGYDDGRVALAAYPDMASPHVLATLPTGIDRLVFSADGSRLVASSVNDDYNSADGELSVWDIANRTAFFRVSPNPAAGTLSLTPDGSTLVLADQEFRCLDYFQSPPTLISAITGEALNERNTSLTAAAVSPDGRYVAGTGCGVVVWDSQTYKVVADFLGNGINVVWSPDGTKLAAATRFGIYVWDMP